MMPDSGLLGILLLLVPIVAGFGIGAAVAWYLHRRRAPSEPARAVGPTTGGHKKKVLLLIVGLVILIVLIPLLAFGWNIVQESGETYEDDFSNPASGFGRLSTKLYEADYMDGEYHILVKAFRQAAWAWNRDAGRFGDFTLEIDARLVSRPSESAYGLVFRVQDDNNFYRFLVSENGYYLVDALLNGRWNTLRSWTKSAFINEGNSTNHLKVVCQGSQIQLYVNEQHLTTLTDDSFAEGYVGMIAYTPEGNSRVAFDDIRVSSLD